MSLSALKKASASNFDTLNSKINALMNPTRQDNDERFWQPTVDKAGNGYAVIRFLPPPELDEIPFARVWDHGFKGPGGWYIENSLTTIDKPDPVTEYNNHLWETGGKAGKDFVSGTQGHPGSKRRLHFYSNVLVLEDPAKPENVGKVFLYRYGKKIFDKANNMMNPKFPNQPKVNPFDLWTGANFNMRIQKVEGQRNYDESTFDKSTPVADNDPNIEAIWKQTYSLKEFVDPENFKTYDELKAKLDRALGEGYTGRAKTVEEAEAAPQSFPKTKATPGQEKSPPWDSGDETSGEAVDGEDELAKFKRLVNS